MKTLSKSLKELKKAHRWDIDFHLPAEGIKAFPKDMCYRIDEVATVAKDKRDPTKSPESTFQYIDISSVDVSTGMITNPQDVDGIDAPSRARKVVQAFDLVISTCRPTRGAIAVVPVNLHDQIASTGFSIIRANPDINPFYLHYAIRLPSTLEQFRKWSTGSSYPAILDSDVEKTIIPVPSPEVQDEVAAQIVAALLERAAAIREANNKWKTTLSDITASFTGNIGEQFPNDAEENVYEFYSITDVRSKISELPNLTVDKGRIITQELNLED